MLNDVLSHASGRLHSANDTSLATHHSCMAASVQRTCRSKRPRSQPAATALDRREFPVRMPRPVRSAVMFCGDVPSFCESGRAGACVPRPTDVSPPLLGHYAPAWQHVHRVCAMARGSRLGLASHDQRAACSVAGVPQCPAEHRCCGARSAPEAPFKDADYDSFPRPRPLLHIPQLSSSVNGQRVRGVSASLIRTKAWRDDDPARNVATIVIWWSVRDWA